MCTGEGTCIATASAYAETMARDPWFSCQQSENFVRPQRCFFPVPRPSPSTFLLFSSFPREWLVRVQDTVRPDMKHSFRSLFLWLGTSVCVHVSEIGSFPEPQHHLPPPPPSPPSETAVFFLFAPIVHVHIFKCGNLWVVDGNISNTLVREPQTAMT